MAQNAFGSPARTCLIIDDDAAFAAFVDKVAQGLGLQTRILTDPTQLERCLETFKPNIITLDMDMPLRTGLEVLDVLTPRGLDARVIIISGTPPNHERGPNPRVGNARVFAIMPKPVRRTELREILGKAMDQAQIERAFSF